MIPCLLLRMTKMPEATDVGTIETLSKFDICIPSIETQRKISNLSFAIISKGTPLLQYSLANILLLEDILHKSPNFLIPHLDFIPN